MAGGKGTKLGPQGLRTPGSKEGSKDQDAHKGKQGAKDKHVAVLDLEAVHTNSPNNDTDQRKTKKGTIGNHVDKPLGKAKGSMQKEVKAINLFPPKI